MTLLVVVGVEMMGELGDTDTELVGRVTVAFVSCVCCFDCCCTVHTSTWSAEVVTVEVAIVEGLLVTATVVVVKVTLVMALGASVGLGTSLFICRV